LIKCSSKGRKSGDRKLIATEPMNPATDIMIEDLVNSTIPIYTALNPHPVKKKKDCEIERQYKRGIRLTMRKELQAVIIRYENKVKEL
jgi:hypothetical protein